MIFSVPRKVPVLDFRFDPSSWPAGIKKVIINGPRVVDSMDLIENGVLKGIQYFEDKRSSTIKCDFLTKDITIKGNRLLWDQGTFPARYTWNNVTIYANTFDIYFNEISAVNKQVKRISGKIKKCNIDIYIYTRYKTFCILDESYV